MKFFHLLTMVASLFLIVTGCGTKNTDTPPPTQNENPPATNEPNQPPADQDPTDSPNEEPKKPDEKPKEPVVTTPPSKNPPTNQPPRRPAPRQSILDEVFPLALKGQVLYSAPIAIGTPVEEIHKQWGKPSWTNGNALEYKDKGILITLFEGRVHTIQIQHQEFQQYTLEDVKVKLGRPDREYNAEGYQKLMYHVGHNTIFLEFDMPHKNPNPKWLSYYIIPKSNVQP